MSSSSKKKKSKKQQQQQQPIRSQDTITYHAPAAGANPSMPASMPQGAYPTFVYSSPAPGQPMMMPVGQLPPGAVVVPGAVPMSGRPLPTQPPAMQQSPAPQKQLDFNQAMTDFKTMFPKMDRTVIETVLRANSGKVDETIDQLLRLNEDIPEPAPPVQHHMPPPSGHPIPPSQLPQEFMPPSFPAEPPPYSPPEPDSPFSRYNNVATTNAPTQSPVDRRTTAPPGAQRVLPPSATPLNIPPDIPPDLPPPRRAQSWAQDERASPGNSTSRQWNPAVRGDLPSDFLRMSLSESPSNSSPTPVSSSPSGQQGQPKMTRGIQERLDQNRRRSMDQNTHRDTQSAQIIEDERIALMLQNEEFLRQLQGNPDFLSALERDYEESLRDGSANRNNSSVSSTPTPTSQTGNQPTPAPNPIPAPKRSQPPPLPELPPTDEYEQPNQNPNILNRPLPATPTSTASPNYYAPGLPARPVSLRKDSSSSSLGSSGLASPGLPNGASSSRPLLTGAEGGTSIEDIEFRNKLNHMGKSSKTTLSLLAGKFAKKKNKSKKYEQGSEGGTDPLLADEGLYEELAPPKPGTAGSGGNRADGNVYHEARKSSKKKLSLKSRHRDSSLLYYEDTDPNFFSR